MATTYNEICYKTSAMHYLSNEVTVTFQILSTTSNEVLLIHSVTLDCTIFPVRCNTKILYFEQKKATHFWNSLPADISFIYRHSRKLFLACQLCNSVLFVYVCVCVVYCLLLSCFLFMYECLFSLLLLLLLCITPTRRNSIVPIVSVNVK